MKINYFILSTVAIFSILVSSQDFDEDYLKSLPDEVAEDITKQGTSEDYSALATSETINVPVKEEDKTSEAINNVDSSEMDQPNGLENFNLEDIEENTPNLFNSDDKELDEEKFTSFENQDDKSDEDDLEIPAFLRRQKN